MHTNCSYKTNADAVVEPTDNFIHN